ncbi:MULTISPECIES: hypothetical protein [unclassified Neptuniibacter]|uniref:hypothetical protein n=1 Tax=unclassified Neptuniibacter TaxID=2630693 RepID=UPI0025DBB518|nr:MULTISPECIES: hypothetical protein [unclassified Neptuniibacter]|tara:strand:- start:834 stop:1109 length:276 start_codon:yes stop_codon:yes gene_type:complete
MSKTIELELDENYQVIADSIDYSTATVQVRGSNSAEIIVDERTDAERTADEDSMGVIYGSLERAPFAGWDGEIRARCPHGKQKTKIAVILS